MCIRSGRIRIPYYYSTVPEKGIGLAPQLIARDARNLSNCNVYHWTSKPQAMVDSKGNLILIYINKDGNLSFLRRTYYGAWSYPYQVSYSNLSSNPPLVKIDQNNVLHVMWNEHGNLRLTRALFQYRRFENGAWSAIENPLPDYHHYPPRISLSAVTILFMLSHQPPVIPWYITCREALRENGHLPH